MVQSVEGALKAIGAEDRQAMIIAHNDTADRNPHCHVIINLIGDDGRLLKSYNDHKKLSRFALEEEIRIHGEPVVQERRKRWHDREAGETPAPMKKTPRHQYELEKQAKAENDHSPEIEQLRERQRILEQRKAEQQNRQERNRERLREILQERQRRLKTQQETIVRRSKTNARKIYDKPWKELHATQQTEREQFEANEKSVKGSIENGLKLFDWSKLFHRAANAEGKRLKDLFQTLTSEAKRRQIVLDRQESERQAMRKEQRAAEMEAEKIAKQHYSERQEKAREDYVRKAARMKERQKHNAQQLKDAQREINQQRNDLLREQREFELEQKRKLVLQQKLRREFDEAARSDEDQKESGEAEKTEQGTATIDPKPTRKRRERKPRDQETSRRKRDIEKREQETTKQNDQDKAEPESPTEDDFEKRMLDYMNRQREDRDRDLDFDR
ncbi:hypothetical protein NHH03_23575 [Stieleria sp. TO1_6]|uniref:hypothetical protein n=1 Tax=Stieleria tagensis TaxID=2956795 RepID=UPI00209B3491|nr:hypothetical protein [Stieleria tagensis]MCO8124738.1 hypothetical protein [Stieleria tagensis]